MPLPEAFSPSPLNVEGGSFGNPLPYRKESQEQRQWCWAAAAVIVARCFGEEWEQCEVVNEVLGVTTSCEDGSSFDVTMELEKALAVVGHYDTSAEGSIGIEQVRYSINVEKKPICAAVSLDDGMNHFVVIYGCSGDKLMIGNPGDDDAIVSINDFAYNWEETYWT